MLAPFDSPKALLDRAHHHLADLEHKSTAFFSPERYTRFIEVDPDTGYKLYKLRFADQIPPLIHCIAFDAISCIRSALDHVVYDATLAITDTTTRERTKFPFGRTYTDAANQFDSNAVGVSPAIRDFLLNFKPYKEGGDETFWAFNEMRNSTIHKMLAPANVGPRGFRLSNGYYGKSESLNIWDRDKMELTYNRSDPATTGETHPSLTIFFADGVPLGGKSAHGALSYIASVAAGIVRSLETETTHILASRP